METKKKYQCPVCSKTYDTLTEIKDCISKHEQEEARAKEEEKKNRIKSIQEDNERLLAAIKSNCNKLSTLGVTAKVSYWVEPEKPDIRIKSSEFPFPFSDELWNTFH